MMNDQTLITIVAIICICILEIVALLKGIDGAMLATVFTLISGLAGYKVGELKERLKSKK